MLVTGAFVVGAGDANLGVQAAILIVDFLLDVADRNVVSLAIFEYPFDQKLLVDRGQLYFRRDVEPPSAMWHPSAGQDHYLPFFVFFFASSSFGSRENCCTGVP